MKYKYKKSIVGNFKPPDISKCILNCEKCPNMLRSVQKYERQSINNESIRIQIYADLQYHHDILNDYYVGVRTFELPNGNIETVLLHNNYKCLPLPLNYKFVNKHYSKSEKKELALNFMDYIEKLKSEEEI